MCPSLTSLRGVGVLVALTACVLVRGPNVPLRDLRATVGGEVGARGIALLYCDPPSAPGAAAPACAPAQPVTCLHDGVALALGRGATADPDRALALFVAACATGDACACVNVAAVLGSRRDRPSLTRAAELLRRGCDQGFMRACAELGMNYRGGLLVGDGGPPVLPRDPPRGHALALRACDANEPMGCYVAAANLMAGRGTPPSDVAAVAYLSRACAGGIDIACLLEGFARLDGHGCARDPSAAQQRFDRACALGEPLGCYALARMYRDGLAPSSDPARVRSLDARACAGGVRAACEPEG